MQTFVWESFVLKVFTSVWLFFCFLLLLLLLTFRETFTRELCAMLFQLFIANWFHKGKLTLFLYLFCLAYTRRNESTFYSFRFAFLLIRSREERGGQHEDMMESAFLCLCNGNKERKRDMKRKKVKKRRTTGHSTVIFGPIF